MLNLPGVHNVQNALAAIAAGLEVGVPPEKSLLRSPNSKGSDGASSNTVRCACPPAAASHSSMTMATIPSRWPRPSPRCAALFRAGVLSSHSSLTAIPARAIVSRIS